MSTKLWISISLLFLIYSPLIMVTGQSSCPLPTVDDIERELIDLLLDADTGGGPYDPTVSSHQYTCLAQGSTKDTYRSVSIIATFTPKSGQSSQTEHFQLTCSSGTWSAVTNHGFGTPPSNPMLRTDCFTCVPGNLGGDDNHCLACNSACNNGSRRCLSNSPVVCCPFFGLDNMCTTSCPTNYTANVDTNFTCVCNYTCGPGEVANATCNGCDLNDICLRDMPCQNGGSCVLLSAPDNYTCDCSGTGYIGTNCTVVCNYTCGPGEVVNATCNGCDLTDICLRDMPCQNEGSCVLLSAPDNYTCDCSGTGYIGTNCTVVCNYTCGPGEVVNATCNGCDLTDICLRDMPCQNGGLCVLLSAPGNYTCNCSGTGYIGTNCTEITSSSALLSSSTTPSSTPSSPSPSPLSSSYSPPPSTSLITSMTSVTPSTTDKPPPGIMAAIVIGTMFGILLLLLLILLAVIIYLMYKYGPSSKRKVSPKSQQL